MESTYSEVRNRTPCELTHYRMLASISLHHRQQSAARTIIKHASCVHAAFNASAMQLQCHTLRETTMLQDSVPRTQHMRQHGHVACMHDAPIAWLLSCTSCASSSGTCLQVTHSTPTHSTDGHSHTFSQPQVQPHWWQRQCHGRSTSRMAANTGHAPWPGQFLPWPHSPWWTRRGSPAVPTSVTRARGQP